MITIWDLPLEVSLSASAFAFEGTSYLITRRSTPVSDWALRLSLMLITIIASQMAIWVAMTITVGIPQFVVASSMYVVLLAMLPRDT